MKTPHKLMQSANGESCTLNIPEFCGRGTVVVCHLSDGSGGSNRLTGPLSFAYGCTETPDGPGCHEALDRHLVQKDDRDFYEKRGMMRTMTRLVERNILKW